jgi:hypothetical protein
METQRWQEVLERNRFDNFRQKKYDLCIYWRALAFREHAGEPEVLVRARAFQNVLEHLEFEIDAGLLPGNCRALTSNSLPQSAADSDYAALLQAHQTRGQRDFWAGFDHTLADFHTLLAVGVAGLRKQIQDALPCRTTPDEQIFLQAVDITLQAFSAFIWQVGQAARRAGQLDAAEACEAVVEAPPRSFRQALQLVWLVHLAFKSEGRCHMALGVLTSICCRFTSATCAKELCRKKRRWICSVTCGLAWMRLEKCKIFASVGSPRWSGCYQPA